MISVMLTAGLLVYGCKGRAPAPPEPPKGTVIARVNNYEITAEDLKERMRLMMRGEYPARVPDEAIGNILDEMITRQVLLQEAQKENFDKDKAFMKEIERYWEQALLKLLYRKKAREISASISVTDKEVADRYKQLLDEGDIDAAKEPFDKVSFELKTEIQRKKLEEAFNKWVARLKSKSNIKIYANSLKEI